MPTPIQKRLNIGFVIQDHNWDPKYNGGAALQLNHILYALREAGHQVTIFLLRWGKEVLCSTTSRTYQPCKFSFTQKFFFSSLESGVRYTQNIFRLPWFQVFDSMRIVDAINHNFKDFDLLHERNHMYGFGGALTSKILKVPYVLSVDADFLLEHDYMGITHSRLERMIATWTARYNYRHAKMVTCVTDATKSHLAKNWGLDPNKIVVIPNGAPAYDPPDPIIVAELQQVFSVEQHPIVMFIGNFWPWHGISDLIRAFQLVLQSLPQAKLLLVGDGETRSESEKLVESLGLTENIDFVGRIPHENVSAYLEIAEVVVAPYPRMSLDFWGAPMKIFEYMAAGKAIVATRVGQIPEYLDYGLAGKLVEAGDIETMSQAIICLLRDPDIRKRLGENARERAKTHYSWKNYAKRLEEVYYQALQ